jgi:hypothetical protein
VVPSCHGGIALFAGGHAATAGPYNIPFGSGLAGLGLSSLLNGYGNHPFLQYHFLLDKNFH